MNLTPEQLAITNFVKTGQGHGLIRARAGSGKTTNLILNIPHMQGKIAFAVYNKKIAEEITPRISGLAKFRTDVKTIHAFGWQAWKDHVGKRPPNPDSDKVLQLAGGPRTKGAFDIAKAVSLAKQFGIGVIPNAPAWEELIDHFQINSGANESRFIDDCEHVLHQSNEIGTEIIDFDDMVYLPLLWGAKFPTYAWVLIDEAQDISALRFAVALKLCGPDTRVLAVGDDKQAIYGFSGADSDSLQKIGSRLQAQELSLSICWRCPISVIESVQHICPTIYPAADAAPGLVESIDFHEFDALVQPGDAVLCRLNRPLLENALKLIRRGVKAKIEGRDIGKSLIALANRRKWDNWEQLIENLEAIAEAEEEKFKKNPTSRMQSKLDRMFDSLWTLRVLIGRAQELGLNGKTAFADMINDLFEDNASRSDVVLFCSVHKSKGLEWPRVFILHRHGLMPFKPDRCSDWQLEQENNLIYVAHTRAQKELYLVDKS